MVAPKFRSERKKKRLRASESVAAIGLVGGDPAKPGGEYCPVVTDPTVLAAPVLIIFSPSCVLILRSTLANLTLNRICASGGGTSTYRRFTVFPRVEAIATARSALVTSLTVPRKKTVSSSRFRFTRCPGS